MQWDRIRAIVEAVASAGKATTAEAALTAGTAIGVRNAGKANAATAMTAGADIRA